MMGERAIDWQERAEMYKRRCDLLEEELDTMKEKFLIISKLNNRSFSIYAAFNLTRCEGTILATLVQHGMATKDRLMRDLYAANPNEPPEPKIVDVFVCKLRKKMKEHNIGIQTQWGLGYSITSEDRAKINAIIDNINDLNEWKHHG